MPVKLTLLTTCGGAESKEFEDVFDKDNISIGRGSSNDLVVPDKTRLVSSKHANIEKKEGTYYVRDVNSKNGTFLNGKQLTAGEDYPLAPDDKIQFGNFTLIVLPVPPADAVREKPSEAETFEKDKKDENYVIDEKPEPIDRLTTKKAKKTEKNEKTVSVVKEDRGDTSLYETAYYSLSAISSHFAGQQRMLNSPEEVERFCLHIRKISEVLLRNLFGALEGRRQFEEEFDAQVTKIIPTGLDPEQLRRRNLVKYAATYEDLGKYLFDRSTDEERGQAVKELNEAFQDILLHQVGLLSGAQKSLEAFLEELNPETIESEIMQAQGRSGWKKFLYKIPLFRRAAVWERLARKHKSFREDHKRTFERVFGRSFGKGYIDSIKKLREKVS